MSGLGLSNVDYSNIEDWQFFGYTSKEEYASFKEQIRNYEEEEILTLEDETFWS